MTQYPPQISVDARSLCDGFTVVLEGAFVNGKAMGDPKLNAKQLRHYRNYLELLFLPKS